MRFRQNMFRSISLILFSLLFFAASTYSQTSNEKIKKALQLIDLGNPDQALTDLKQIAISEPKNPEAHAALALAEIETGDISGADKEVAIAYDIERKNVLVRIARGTLYGKQNKREDAVEEFNRAIKINDKEIASFLYMARFYLSVDSLKSAEIALYRAQAVNGNDVRPFLGLAELYEKQHSLDLAIEQYQDAKKIDAKDVIVIAKLAQLYFRAGKYNDAIKEWDNLSKVDPNYSRAYYEIAHIYDISEDHVNAAKFATKYVALEPENKDGVWLLARSLAESNQYKEALPYLEKAAKNDSLKTFTDLYLARSYFFEKDYPKAIQLYSVSKKLGVYDLYYYGYSLIINGDTLGGLDKWRNALIVDTSGKVDERLKIVPSIISYLNALKKYPELAAMYIEQAKKKSSAEDYANAGAFYTVAKMPQDAELAFNSALKIDPKLLKAKLGIALLIAKDQDRLQAAEKMIDETSAFAVDTKDKEKIGVAYASLGFQYLISKEYEGSIRVLVEKSLKYLTDKSFVLTSVYKGAASAYLQLKNYKKATEYYKKVEAINPKDEDIKKGLDYIKQVQGK